MKKCNYCSCGRTYTRARHENLLHVFETEHTTFIAERAKGPYVSSSAPQAVFAFVRQS